MAERQFRVIVTVEATTITGDDGENCVVETSTKSFAEDEPIQKIVDYVNGHHGYGATINARITLDGCVWGTVREGFGM